MRTTLKSICAAVVAAVVSGCAMFSTNNANMSDNADQLFNQALSTAASVLASEGSQQLAIAAAESVVAGLVENEQAQAIANQIIEQAVPMLATHIASIQLAAEDSATAKSRCFNKYDKCVSSTEYAQLVSLCALEYQNRVRK